MFHRKTQNPDIQVDAKTICSCTLADIVQPPLLGVLLNNEHPHEQQGSGFNPPTLCSSDHQSCAVQLSVVLMSWHISVNLNPFLATSNGFPHTTLHSLKNKKNKRHAWQSRLVPDYLCCLNLDGDQRGQVQEVQCGSQRAHTPGLPSSFCREDSGNESLPHSGLSLISKHTSSVRGLRWTQGRQSLIRRAWWKGRISTRAHALISYSVLSAAMPESLPRLIPHLSLCYFGDEGHTSISRVGSRVGHR